jgi:hypothetical protein
LGYYFNIKHSYMNRIYEKNIELNNSVNKKNNSTSKNP